MSIKIKIPASEITSLKKEALVLENGKRCSRCEGSPTCHYEMHRSKYNVGLKKNRIFENKFQISKSYRIKLAICETCYQSDFLSNPDLLDLDGSPLAKIVQFHNTTRMLGGLLAGLGFLLLTPFIPETDFLTPIKHIWQLPVVIGVIVLLLTWLSQRKFHNRVLAEFEIKHPGIDSYPRAEITTHVLDSEQELSTVPLEINMANESWAIEVAEAHNWAYETISSKSEEIINTESVRKP